MTQLIISNVKNENKYKGAYAQIFNIINENADTFAISVDASCSIS
jgi:hypothetical protein